MNKSNRSNDFQTLLLKQESSLFHPQYQEHRMQIEARLTRAEHLQKIVKVTGTVAILLAAGLFPVIASGCLGSADPWDKGANVLSVSLAIFYWVNCVVAALCIASFYSRFSPTIRQAREDLRDELLLEMRHELADLREQVANLKPAQNP